MSDRCKKCGACQHCGQSPAPTFYPPYYVPYWTHATPNTNPYYYGTVSGAQTTTMMAGTTHRSAH